MALIKVKLPSGQMQSMKVPDDWDQDRIAEEIHKAFPVEEKLSEKLNQEAPSERTGVFGVAGDLASALGNAKKSLFNIPKSLEKSGEYIEQNPGSSIFHNVGQLGAGAAELGKEVVNAPYNLNQYLARKHLLPQVLGKLGKFIPHIPEDTGIEKALGLEADPEKGDQVFRALPAIATVGAGIIGGTKGIKNFFKAPDLKEVIRETQSKVNAANKELGNAFDIVESEVNNRGINKIPVDKSVISQAQTFLAKTPETKDLIARAKKGEYKALRELQADLREIGETALSNKLTTERKVGKEALSARNKINNSIEGFFEEAGHKDLADLLKQTKQGYADIQKTYFSNPALAKVFGKSQKVPKNPVTLLTEESTEMTKFMSAHPEVKAALEKALKHKKKSSLLKGIGKYTAAVLAGEEISRFLHK